MAGLGTELLFLCGLGYVVLGPKRMHKVLQHLARAKAAFEKTKRELQVQLSGAEQSEKLHPPDVS